MPHGNFRELPPLQYCAGRVARSRRRGKTETLVAGVEGCRLSGQRRLEPWSFHCLRCRTSLAPVLLIVVAIAGLRVSSPRSHEAQRRQPWSRGCARFHADRFPWPPAPGYPPWNIGLPAKSCWALSTRWCRWPSSRCCFQRSTGCCPMRRFPGAISCWAYLSQLCCSSSGNR